MRKAIAILLAFICFGCAGNQKQTPVASIPMKSNAYCLIFVVDGIGGDIAEKWIREGKLSNFKKYLYDRGMWVEEATSVFPSVTAVAMTSIMTGVYPGRHDVVNFQWMDRNTGRYKSYIGTDIFDFEKDIDRKVKTIFEYLPKNETASFGFLVSKGSGHSDSLLYSALNPFRDLAPQAHIAISELLSGVALSNGFPRLLSIYNWETDVKGHRKGAKGKETFEELKKADERFGHIVQMYKDKGIYDQTYFVLISDHGMAPVKHRFYVDKFLESHGFKTRVISWNLGESHIPNDWDRVDSLLGTTKRIYDSDSVVGAAGGGCATLDLVENGGIPINGLSTRQLWKRQLKYSDIKKAKTRTGETIDVIDLFSHVKAVDFMVMRDDRDGENGERRVLVISKKGETLIQRVKIPDKGNFYRYQVIKGKDPLDLSDEHQIRPLVNSARFYEERAWYEALRDEDYPDAVVQLCQIFDSPRASTLYLVARKNWCMNAKVIGRHAGLLEEEMIATFCIAGPGIQKSEREQARIVDMVPTVLKLLGVSYSEDQFDGKSLF